MKTRCTLSNEEKYLLGYMRGFRLGQIEVSREILIRYLYIDAKKHNYIPSKVMIKKINRETDIEFLENIILYIFNNKLSAEELDSDYDIFFLVPDKEGKKCLLKQYL